VTWVRCWLGRARNADTRLVEKHYGHLAPSHKRDAIRAGAARFGVVAASNVSRCGNTLWRGQ
jgi:hypothetical protein